MLVHQRAACQTGVSGQRGQPLPWTQTTQRPHWGRDCGGRRDAHQRGQSAALGSLSSACRAPNCASSAQLPARMLAALTPV